MEVSSSYIVQEAIIDQLVDKYKEEPGGLLSTLEAVQEANPLKFLPVETLTQVSKKLNVPLSQVYSVVSFYSFFNLKPQGKHVITVCRGTACHTKGSRGLLDSIGQILGYKCELDEAEPSYTTPDNEFTIKTVACFGQCAQAPVVAVDGVIHSNVNERKLLKILRKVKTSKSKSKSLA